MIDGVLAVTQQHAYVSFVRPIPQQICKAHLPADLTPVQVLQDSFNRYLRRSDLITMEIVQAGLLTELVYSVEMKAPREPQAFLAALSQANKNNKVVLVTGAQEIDL